MRKILILQESFMALEQIIAESLDSAEKRVGSIKEELKGKLDQLFSQIQNQESFNSDPAFINWKSESFVGLPAEIESDIPASIRKIKETISFPLETSALISKIHSELKGMTNHEDEIDEISCFFGKENTNIPEPKEGKAILTLSETAKLKAFEELGKLREMFEDHREKLDAAYSTGKTKEAVYSALEKMLLLKELTKAILQ
jgi:hypothetical protein